MTREAKKQANLIKPEKTPATKSKVGDNYYLSPSEDLQINSTGEVDMKTKFNLSTTNKGTEIETGIKTRFDCAIKFENTRTKLFERTI